MANIFNDDELSRSLAELCESKAEEFQMLGYEQVSSEDIWNCIQDKYKNGVPALHKTVNDILSLKVTDLMNWLTISAFKGEFR